ncbi:hypothetical protein KCG48_11735 [Proteiniclasticum sp. BAD-10]|uniref:Lipoprotein n=1 Tax=Proteiniclasticum sediminis TaxID=2804028 RepID=A0A941HS80_9CLOT|nr:hypothetical protein [Proteiniclasticum sediminis]MBR0576987.1 hypothetical protein [Proteiniclasticum sediminis]
MRNPLRLLAPLFLFLFLLTGCGPQEKYLPKEEALSQGFVVMDGLRTENSERFEVFLENIGAKRADTLDIVIFDLTGSQYVVHVEYDGTQFLATSYFMTPKSEKSHEVRERRYSDIIMTSAKNYFLVNQEKTEPDLWIFQGN